MRGGILAAGIILLILGIFFYFIGNNMIREVEAYDVEGLPISEILKLVSEGARSHYETGQSLVMFGSIFGIIGFILCIAGIAAPSKHIEINTPVSHQPSVIVQQVEPRDTKHSSRHCPECGRSIPFDAKRCPYCENDFEHRTPRVEKKEATDIKEEKKSIEKKEFLQFCHDCGKKLDEDVDFCPHCGKKLSKLEE